MAINNYHSPGLSDRVTFCGFTFTSESSCLSYKWTTRYSAADIIHHSQISWHPNEREFAYSAGTTSNAKVLRS